MRSAAVLGYALESFVDVWSSILVLYRFWDDKTEAEATRHRERLASFGISLTVRALMEFALHFQEFLQNVFLKDIGGHFTTRS